MDFKYLYKTQKVNILIAMLIGMFAIFPDVIRQFTDTPPLLLPGEVMKTPDMQERSSDVHEAPPTAERAPHNNAKPPHKLRGRSLQSVLLDLLLFFILSWVLLLLNNPDKRKIRVRIFFIPPKARPFFHIGITFIICFAGVFLISLLHQKSFPRPRSFPWYLNGMLLFKGIFVFVSVVLISQVLSLLYKQQTMRIENEKLRTKSFQNRFDALTAQVSPHFFFNSLNSLSGLVRDKQNKKALKYINEISNLFRYILKGSWQELVYLEEEMDFLSAYQYILDIKYSSNLIFEIDINDAEKRKYKLPALSIQPLIENIIKHNTISEESPILIRVSIKDKRTLVVANRFQPKAQSDNRTGIGLNNLWKRYKLLTGKDIKYYLENSMFNVELPLDEID